MKSTLSVTVVQNKITAQIRVKPAAGSLLDTCDKGTPIAHRRTTLYTLMPINFESFRTGTETLRVSKARNKPKTRRRL